MTIAELIQNLQITVKSGSTATATATTITNIVDDSRAASGGCLFIARRGMHSDGTTFIGDAIDRGAVAVLAERDTEIPNGIVALRTDDVQRTTAVLAERFFGNPSSALTLIGVTGTNGKTTVAHLVQQLLTSAGRRCGMIGTVAVYDGREDRPAALTTPGAIETSRLVRAMIDNGCDACVMEVSSHALQQDRAAALDFDIAVFTNLSGDHLDYHGTMQQYAAAKAKLFELLGDDGHAVLNCDDAQWQNMVHACRARVHRCSLMDDAAECVAQVLSSTVAGSDVTLRMRGRESTLRIPLIGRHNVMNALQAMLAVQTAGVDQHSVTDALQRCTAPPGRFERVDGGDTGVTILVDYAHTDDALENALSALRPLVPVNNRLHVVFGCGGDRDRTKRPRMAAAACRWADRVILTSDNPRTEDPQHIVNEVAAGVPAGFSGSLQTTVDRATAIHDAIAAASPGDVVLIAGKGHEDYQIIGTTKRPFDDRVVAAEAVTSRAEVCP